jgi:hypothetical protein
VAFRELFGPFYVAVVLIGLGLYKDFSVVEWILLAPIYVLSVAALRIYKSWFTRTMQDEQRGEGQEEGPL